MKSKIIEDRAYIVNLVYNFQSIGKVVVLIHGTFDILHLGHIELLQKAKEFGDILIVGVYNDNAVRAIKGPDRPVTSLHERMTILGELSLVSYVIPLEHPQHEQVIAQVKPNIFVQLENSKYQLDTSFLEKYKGTMRTVSVSDKHSVSALIKKIRNFSQSQGIE